MVSHSKLNVAEQLHTYLLLFLLLLSACAHNWEICCGFYEKMGQSVIEPDLAYTFINACGLKG